MATQNEQQLSLEQAHEIACDLHKQAFLGRLAQLGEQPRTQKEAAALLDLGVALYESNISEVKEASDGNVYGDGPYAKVLQAYLNKQSGPVAPGFEHMKQASSHFASASKDIPQLPQQLLDGAWNAAVNLAQQPHVYEAAIVKQAHNEALLAEAQQEGEGNAETQT